MFHTQNQAELGPGTFSEAQLGYLMVWFICLRLWAGPQYKGLGYLTHQNGALVMLPKNLAC